MRLIEKHRAERAMAGYTVSVSPRVEAEFFDLLRGLLTIGGRIFPDHPKLHEIARILADGQS